LLVVLSTPVTSRKVFKQMQSSIRDWYRRGEVGRDPGDHLGQPPAQAGPAGACCPGPRPDAFEYLQGGRCQMREDLSC